MKKKLVSGLAISFIVAIAIFTITAKSKKTIRAAIYFQYVGVLYTENSVENPANWVEVQDLTSGCNNINRRACRIQVSDNDTDGFSPNRTLKAGFTIVTSTFGGQAYVLNAGDVIQARNKL